ncbi:MAG TPA: hypothetical protein PLW02_06855 [Verrucomicrobiota bacterium]|nr:hypothetical protein [Verrucomicrobiota bacterium]
MKRRLLLIFVGLVFVVVNSNGVDFSEKAAEFKKQISEKVLPYWYDTAIDKVNGGYFLSDDLKGRKPNSEKQIVTQSRMV